MNVPNLRAGIAALLLLLFFPVFLSAQDRDVRGERIVVDDNAADGGYNTLVIQPSGPLTQDILLTIPDVGSATAEFLLLPPGGGAWLFGGNAGTTAGTDFLGTSDLQPFHLYVNGGGTNSLILDTTGSLHRGNGGNARGTDAVDLQRVRSNVAQVASGLYSTIGGGRDNTASNSYATVGGGRTNTASDLYTTVAGGQQNAASGDRATVGGGQQNTAFGNRSTVAGGRENAASGDHAAVLGGYQDTASGSYATVGGGSVNKASASFATVGGGTTNTASGSYATVGGGYLDTASGPYAVVAGGWDNTASGDQAFVGGGWENVASGERATVGGGWVNTASGERSTVAGGWQNTASGQRSAVGGGATNTASASYATIGGGQLNAATGDRSTVAGGYQDTATGLYSTIGGGQQNTAAGHRSTVGGGQLNTVAGDYSVIPGGRGLTLSATADRSFGFLADGGSNAMSVSAPDVAVFGNASLWLANNNNTASQLRLYEANAVTGAFPGSANYSSFEAQGQTADIQYLLPAAVPGTLPANDQVLTITGITGTQITLSWVDNTTLASDRAKKENFTRLSGENVLERFRGIPLGAWNYRGERTRHYGIMAQDFFSTFGGPDAYGVIGTDTTVNVLDLHGVAFLAIQGLEERTAQSRRETDRIGERTAGLERENRELRAELSALRAEVVRLAAQLRETAAQVKSEEE